MRCIFWVFMAGVLTVSFLSSVKDNLNCHADKNSCELQKETLERTSLYTIGGVNGTK